MIKTFDPGRACTNSQARVNAIAPATQPSSVMGKRRTSDRNPIRLIRCASSDGIMNPLHGDLSLHGDDVEIYGDVVLHLHRAASNANWRDAEVALPDGCRALVVLLIAPYFHTHRASLTVKFQLASDQPTIRVDSLDRR